MFFCLLILKAKANSPVFSWNLIHYSIANTCGLFSIEAGCSLTTAVHHDWHFHLGGDAGCIQAWACVKMDWSIVAIIYKTRDPKSKA